MSGRLTRNTRQAVVAGVASGLGDYLEVDPVLVRLAFVFLCFFGGSGILLYLIAWALIPRDGDAVGPAAGEGPPPQGASPGEPSGDAPRTGPGQEDVPPLERLAHEATEAGARVAREASQAGRRAAATVREHLPRNAGRGRLVFGIILIIVGMLFLMDRFLPFRWFWLWDLWPLGLIAVGLMILLNARAGAADDR
ncbi:MAG: PspC domain-containing protein [Acidobacteriota bacterium]|jgi:phage shock protein PspC (stress-responsive transcriptional regulator)